MSKKRGYRYLILLLFLAALTTIILGFALELDSKTADRLKGIGTVGLFFIVMPLFLLIESPGKEVKDYMLTEENIKKMRGGERKRKS